MAFCVRLTRLNLDWVPQQFYLDQQAAYIQCVTVSWQWCGWGSGGWGVGLLGTGNAETPGVPVLFVSTIDYTGDVSGPPIYDNGWHHVVYGHDGYGQTMTYWLDGVMYGPYNYNPWIDGEEGNMWFYGFGIGCRGDNFGSSFWGDIDELTFYSRISARLFPSSG
jgi:hypothetical protein